MISTTENNPGPRFALRKRSIRNNRDMVNLSSYNSDFLSGLFADVAKANVLTEDESSCKRGSELISSEPSLEVSVSETLSSNKKSRTSLTRTLTRVCASSKNLTTFSHTSPHSPTGINEFFGSAKTKKTMVPASLASSNKHESLAFQLNCVGATTHISGVSTSRLAIGDAAKIAFPNLPATVSDSSCSAGLTRANLVRNVSTPENEPKDCFGWFVDLEDNQTSTEAPTGLPYAVSCDDLAFQAPTAPNGVNNDAEVEWAKAADTVDDVLGDFF